MNRLLIVIFILMGLISCKTDSKTTTNTEVVETKTLPKADNPMMAKLYEHYSTNPQTQLQKDENAIIEYLASKNRPFKRYPNGLYMEMKKEGEGPKYLKGQPSRVDYRGYTLDGKIFDSSFKRGRPMDFKAGQMIPGWNQAQYDVSPGAELTIIVPSYLAYGDRGFPGAIAPNTPIAFDVYFKSLSEQVN